MSYYQMDDGENMAARIGGKCGGSSKTFVWDFQDGKHDSSIA